MMGEPRAEHRVDGGPSGAFAGLALKCCDAVLGLVSAWDREKAFSFSPNSVTTQGMKSACLEDLGVR